MTHILLARHGETEWNKIGRVQGWTDIGLSADGESQAVKLANRLSKTPLAAVYSSELSRAVQTAEAVAAPHGLPVQTLPGLREKGYGLWEGLTREDLERDWTDLWHQYHTLRVLETVVPEGETWPEVCLRTVEALKFILAGHPGADDTVLVVGHGGSARALVLEALQAPLPTLLRLHLDNASLSRLDFHSLTDSQVVFLNDTSHLGGPPA